MDTLRLSDADREAAVERLGEQYAVGRLTKDEFDERSDAVWSAKTKGDLAPVFDDLPSRARAATPARSTGQRGRAWRVPFLPVLFVIVGIALIAKAPFLLFGLLFWFCFARPHWHGSRHWSGHHSRTR